MSLVSTAQLTQLRAVAYRGLDTDVTIQRRTFSETDADVSYSWTTVAVVKGWIRQMNDPRITAEFGHLAGTTGVYRLHVSHEVDLRQEDRCIVGGEKYEVQNTNEENTIQIYRTATLRRIE